MVLLSLDWTGDLNFKNSDGSPAIELQSSSPGYTSPPQALAYALMGCMAMDVVEILQKGRFVIEALTTTFEGERAPSSPRRWTRMAIHFDLRTNADSRAIQRAIDLSRDKYCSVWRTIRTDTELRTTYAISG